MPDGKDGQTNPNAYRKIHSDATGKRWKARELGYCKRRWTMPEQENRLLYSAYNSSGWTCDAADAGMITIGPRADENYVSWNDNGTTITAVENGIQTWTGTGTLYSGTYDISAQTSLSFSCEFIPYQRSTTQTFTVGLGVQSYPTPGSIVQYEVRRWNLVGGNTIWCLFNVADVISVDTAAAAFYVYAIPDTADGKWAAIDMCVQYGRYKREAFVQTSGAAVVEAARELRGIGKIHRTEWELVQENWEGVVTPREGQDQSSYQIPTEDV